MDNEIKSKIKVQERISAIRVIHIVSIILWLFIIVVMGLNNRNVVGIFILFIPIFVSFGAIVSAPQISEKVEDKLFNSNFLSLGIVILIPLLSWVSKDNGMDSRKFGTISILAVMLSLASYIDFWVPEKYIFTVFHIQSILQTYSLVLVIFALYSYYEIQPRNIFSDVLPFE